MVLPPDVCDSCCVQEKRKLQRQQRRAGRGQGDEPGMNKLAVRLLLCAK